MPDTMPQLKASSFHKTRPAEIIDKLNKEINAGLTDPKMKARLADLGGTPISTRQWSKI